MRSFEEDIALIEEDTELSIISATEIKLSKAVLALLRRALNERRTFFVMTYDDHDDSVELIIDELEYIVLFRQEGRVVNAKSFYIYRDDSFEDVEEIEAFLSQFNIA